MYAEISHILYLLALALPLFYWFPFSGSTLCFYSLMAGFLLFSAICFFSFCTAGASCMSYARSPFINILNLAVSKKKKSLNFSL
jgi:hypothetical protein